MLTAPRHRLLLRGSPVLSYQSKSAGPLPAIGRCYVQRSSRQVVENYSMIPVRVASSVAISAAVAAVIRRCHNTVYLALPEDSLSHQLGDKLLSMYFVHGTKCAPAAPRDTRYVPSASLLVWPRFWHEDVGVGEVSLSCTC